MQIINMMMRNLISLQSLLLLCIENSITLYNNSKIAFKNEIEKDVCSFANIFFKLGLSKYNSSYFKFINAIVIVPLNKQVLSSGVI